MIYENPNFKSLQNSDGVEDQFNEWKTRSKNKLSKYNAFLGGSRLKIIGDLEFNDGQKSFDYETTYFDIISLKGKRRPRETTLNAIIEYDHERDNIDEMRGELDRLTKIKINREPVSFSINEIDIDYAVTIDNINVTYRGVRDIYLELSLVEVYDYMKPLFLLPSIGGLPI